VDVVAGAVSFLFLLILQCWELLGFIVLLFAINNITDSTGNGGKGGNGGNGGHGGDGGQGCTGDSIRYTSHLT
jgi:hypothetical protein